MCVSSYIHKFIIANQEDGFYGEEGKICCRFYRGNWRSKKNCKRVQVWVCVHTCILLEPNIKY